MHLCKIYATWACHFTGLHTHTHRHRAVVIDWKTSRQHTQNSLATSHARLPSPCCACCNCLKAFAICYNALRSALLCCCCCGKSFAAEKCAYLVFSTSYLLPVECTQISCTPSSPPSLHFIRQAVVWGGRGRGVMGTVAGQRQKFTPFSVL